MTTSIEITKNTMVITNLKSELKNVTEQMTVTNKNGFKRAFKKAVSFVETNKEVSYNKLYQELVKLNVYYSSTVVPTI